MILIEEFGIFIKNILHWLYYFVVFSAIFFVFGFEKIVIFGTSYILPMPSPESFSVQIFNIALHDLLPPGVQLITTNPMSAFVSQMLVSIFLGFLIALPLLLYKIITYIHPALLPREKRVVFWSIVPLVLLFFSGCLFSYYFLIPATFKVLYPFSTVMGAVPFFTIDEFVSYVFGLMLAVGVMFLLPLFMILLSFVGIIKASFWKQKWRYALVFFLALSAIITPDGTGVTMAMLFIPLMGLYFVGYIFANKVAKSYDY